MTLHFVVNPVAKNGHSLKIWSKLETILKQKQIDYYVHFTKAPGDGVIITKKIINKTDHPTFIVAVGGDGTIHEIVNGIYPYRNGIIGFIPAGSGNDFARGFLLPKQPEAALNKILSYIDMLQNQEFFDTGFVEGNEVVAKSFINNFGIGFDAHVAKKVNESKLKAFFNKLHLGKLTYLFYLIKELFTFSPTSANVMIDHKEMIFHKVWLVTISNHPFFGGGIKISPQSNPQDGLLDVTVVHNISRWKILLLFVTIYWGGHTKLKEVFSIQGKHIKIDCKSKLPIHADGEYIGTGNVNVQLHPDAVRIMRIPE